MDPIELLKLECTVAAILAAGGMGEGGDQAAVIVRYRAALLALRNWGGPLMPDIPRKPPRS
jgi:hypothetical protein